MTCDLILEWLDDYFEDQLDEQNRAKFEQHIKTCSDCQMLIEDFRSMKEVMFEMPLMALPNDFNESLHEKLMLAAEEIKAEQKPSKKVIAFPVKMKKTFQYIGAAAAVVIIVASTIQLQDSLWWNQNNSNQTAYELKNAGGPEELPPMTVDSSSSDAVMPETVATTTFGATGGDTPNAEPANTGNPNPLAKSIGAESGRMLIRTGDVTLEVGNYDNFYKQIETLTLEAGGYIESSYSGKSPFYENNKLVGSQLSGSVVLRIPSDKFQGLFEKVKMLGIVQASQQNVQDVTTQITDMTAQVENLKVREARLRELMKQAKNVSEVMTVERELSNVRTQIDQIEGQLKQQKNQVSLSTLYVNVQERPEIGGQVEKLDGNLFERAKQAFIKNINKGIRWFEAGFVWFVAWSPVILILGILALGLTKKYYNKSGRQKK